MGESLGDSAVGEGSAGTARGKGPLGSVVGAGSGGATAREGGPSATQVAEGEPAAAVAGELWMGWALREAVAALETDDVPVGAVVVGPSGELVAAGRNAREATKDPTAHAEVLALRAASRELGSWRLDGCTLVVTLEPCAMCAGASVLARVARVVFGATDPKAGAAGSLWNIPADPRLNHRPEVIGGVRAEECGDLLRTFFRARRRPQGKVVES